MGSSRPTNPATSRVISVRVHAYPALMREPSRQAPDELGFDAAALAFANLTIEATRLRFRHVRPSDSVDGACERESSSQKIRLHAGFD